MNTHREAMNQALKKVLIPVLRAHGFKGTLPHFRRVLSDRVDYLSIQFYSSGGSFVVEIATAGADGKPAGLGRQIPISKINTFYFTHRYRLGSDGSDHWYKFSSQSYEGAELIYPAEHYSVIARQVVQDFERQGEAWFAANAGKST